MPTYVVTRQIAVDTVDEWGRGIWWGTRPGSRPIECDYIKEPKEVPEPRELQEIVT